MPQRLFAYVPLDDLKSLAISVAKAIATGQTQELRSNSSGFLKRTGALTKHDLEETMMNVRYEIYWRGQRATLPEDTEALVLEPTDPYREKIMRIETYNRGNRWNLAGGI